jgi:hypothetical protein
VCLNIVAPFCGSVDSIAGYSKSSRLVVVVTSSMGFQHNPLFYFLPFLLFCVMCVCVLFCGLFGCCVLLYTSSTPIWEKTFSDGNSTMATTKDDKKKKNGKICASRCRFRFRPFRPAARTTICKMFAGFLASETIHGFSLDHHRSVNYIYKNISPWLAMRLACLFSSSRVNSNET